MQCLSVLKLIYPLCDLPLKEYKHVSIQQKTHFSYTLYKHKQM